MPAEDTAEVQKIQQEVLVHPLLGPESLYFVGDITAAVAHHRAQRSCSGLSLSAQPDLCVHPEEQDPKGI